MVDPTDMTAVHRSAAKVLTYRYSWILLHFYFRHLRDKQGPPNSNGRFHFCCNYVNV